jgi:hypothetical protein
MLAIEEKMVGAFINEEARQDTHIRKTLLEHGRGRGGTTQPFHVFAFDHGTAVFENDIGTGALGEAIGHLLANDLIRIGGKINHFGIGQDDFLDGHRVVEA